MDEIPFLSALGIMQWCHLVSDWRWIQGEFSCRRNEPSLNKAQNASACILFCDWRRQQLISTNRKMEYTTLDDAYMEVHERMITFNAAFISKHGSTVPS